MLELKKDTQVWVPVRLLDPTGAPVTGVVDTDVLCSVLKSDGTEVIQGVGVSTWFEATTGALAGTGTYRVRLSASIVNVPGFLTYAVQDSAVPPNVFVGVANIVENLEVDTYTLMLRGIGLMHENSVLDQTAYDGFNNLTAGRMRTYDTKANAQAAGATGLIATYTITATYVGKNVQEYKVVREP